MRRSMCFVGLVVLAASACQSGTKETGIRIGDDTLKHFKEKESRVEWLIALVGQPTSRSVVEGQPNLEIYRYSTTEESGGILSWFTGKSSKATATIYFVIDDGVIVRFWADREKEPTLLGKQKEKDTGEKEEK